MQLIELKCAEFVEDLVTAGPFYMFAETPGAAGTVLGVGSYRHRRCQRGSVHFFLSRCYRLGNI
jgi:hypothetical protein